MPRRLAADAAGISSTSGAREHGSRATSQAGEGESMTGTRRSSRSAGRPGPPSGTHAASGRRHPHCVAAPARRTGHSRNGGSGARFRIVAVRHRRDIGRGHQSRLAEGRRRTGNRRGASTLGPAARCRRRAIGWHLSAVRPHAKPTGPVELGLMWVLVRHPRRRVPSFGGAGLVEGQSVRVGPGSRRVKTCHDDLSSSSDSPSSPSSSVLSSSPSGR
jgi:hypothetical protein